MDNQTCRLWRLTLCDGQRVELPDRALTSCLCDQELRSEQTRDHDRADEVRRLREWTDYASDRR